MPTLKRVDDETSVVSLAIPGSIALSKQASREMKLDVEARQAPRAHAIFDVNKLKGPIKCPRCFTGRVLEDQEHSLYCINCGWRQENSNPKYSLDYIRKMFFRGHAGRPSRKQKEEEAELEARAIRSLRR